MIAIKYNLIQRFLLLSGNIMGKIGKDTTHVSTHEKDSLMFTAEIMFE